MLTESITLMTKTRIGKSTWNVKFHPSVETYEKIRCLIGKNSSFFRAENRNRYTSEMTWDEMIEAGKSYMVGSDVPTKKYLASHTTYMNDSQWLYWAVQWAFENEDGRLIVKTHSKDYEIYRRGEWVEIALPHHGRGGEKHWVVHKSNPNKKILINVD